jgi:polysaccharide biosynthesis/export protein
LRKSLLAKTRKADRYPILSLRRTAPFALLSRSITALALAAAAAVVVYAQAVSQSPEVKAPPIATTTFKEQPYHLEAGDTIEIRFFFNPELNDTVQIRPDGRISLQLVGEADVAGKTIPQAVELIQSAYLRELKTPRVTLQIKSYAGQKVFVTGEVQRPGTISLPGSMSLMAAIEDAGGIKLTGNHDKVVLISKGPDGNPAMREVLLRIKGKPTPDSYAELRPWDVILVPESRITRMDRWVDQWIKQLSPANMSASFNYLYTVSGAATGVPF